MSDLPMPGRRAAIILSLILLIRGITYIAVVPLWQAPDEPSHMEYAMLMGELGRPPAFRDATTQVEGRILRSMSRHDFWKLVGEKTPNTLPDSFRGDPFLRNSGTQVGNEPPLYYVVPAMLSRLSGGNVDLLAYETRLYSLLLLWLTLLVSLWGGKRIWPDAPEMAWALPLFLALAPMPTFVGVAINNDSLAMLTGAFATVAWSLWVRRGGTQRISIAAGLALLLAALSKRTCFFLIPAALLALPIGLKNKWARALTAATVALLFLTLFMPNPRWAAWWQRKPGFLPAERIAAGAGHALTIRDRDTTTRPHLQQEVLAVPIRGQHVTLAAAVRSLGRPAPACFLLDDGTGIEEKCCNAGKAWKECSLSYLVSRDSEFLRVVLATGHLGHPEAVGDWEAASASLRDDDGRNWLRNGDAGNSTSLAGRWVSPKNYTPFWLKRYAVSLGILFTSFWGNFGWLQHPFRLAWYVVLAAVGLGTIVGGALRLLRERPSGGEGRVMLWLFLALCLALVQTLVPMIGSKWRPQGRYLFPALLPIVAWMMWGLASWLPSERKGYAAYFWIAALFILDLVSLIEVVYPAFHPAPPGWWIG